MKKKNISKTLLLSVAVPLMSSSFSTDAVSPKNNETLQAININTIIDNTTMGQLTIAPSLAAVKAFIYKQAKSKNHPDLMNDINIDITATQATVTVAEDISSIYSGSVIISWIVSTKTNLSDVLINRVVLIPTVSSDKSTLNKWAILAALKNENFDSNFNVEQLDADLSDNPDTGPQYNSNTGFWFVNVQPVPDSTFYNAGNVAVNVTPSRISLSNYIRNQSLGTVKVNVNGSTSATDGPQVSDIKNWILSMNPHLDEAFLNCISVSNINVQNTYEYAATITCDTETVNFIDPNNNTIAVNFFGIQEDNLATYKVDSTTGAKTWSTTFYYQNIAGEEPEVRTDGLIPGNVTVIFDGEDLASPCLFLHRNTYDGIVFYSNQITYLRYCTYNRSSTFDLSKINVDSSIFGYDVHAGRYENLHTGNLSLGSSIAFVRHISFPPPPILNIYSTKMLGQETINVMGGNPYFTSPIINLHLPYGSTYRLILNGSYSIEITWTYDNSTYTYPAGYQTHLTITYDNN